MNRYTAQPKVGLSQSQILTLLLTITTLVGCNATTQPLATSNGASTASTQTIEVPVSIDANKIAAQATVDTNVARIKTAAANNPTNAPGPPPTYTPGMPPTPTFGVSECGRPAGQQLYILFNCWHGLVNGQVVWVGAGGEARLFYTNGKGGDSGWIGDLNQGFVAFLHTDGKKDVYLTPIKVGTMGILSTNGTQLTLAAVNWDAREFVPNGQTIVFDVASRQFISPSGTPIVTTPVPTPLATK